MDGFQYTNGNLDFFPTAEGYVKVLSGLGTSAYKYVFNYVDHLGNIRLSYAQDPRNNNELAILEENHYYPYGLKHNGYNGNHSVIEITTSGVVTLTPVNPFLGDTYKYKFGGKEYDDTFNINTYDFGARNYNPALGRWMNLDPLAEKMRRHSPYNYAFDNPNYFIDADGRDIKNANKERRKAVKKELQTNQNTIANAEFLYGTKKKILKVNHNINDIKKQKGALTNQREKW